jgi:2-polyprenyl-3-methyl-5-hydroxy-6-metoxy-1,4-benzoquinol methylase
VSGDSTSDVPRHGWASAGGHGHHGWIWPAIRALPPDEQGLRVLDAGCGSGFIAAQIAALGHAVTGIDASPDGIGLARRAYSGVRFEIASVYDDIAHLMPPGGWNVVVAAEVIEHLYSPQRFLANMDRHLQPGGSIILTTPYHGFLKNLALSLDAWDRHFTVQWEGISS